MGIRVGEGGGIRRVDGARRQWKHGGGTGEAPADKATFDEVSGVNGSREREREAVAATSARKKKEAAAWRAQAVNARMAAAGGLTRLQMQ